MPISFGWAAGDVSLAAYIQACLARREDESDHVSALGAVMAFLYSTYIVIYAILSPVLGGYVDRFLRHGTPQDVLKNVGGVQFTVIGGILLASTFIPAGAFSLNPKLLFGEDLGGEVEPQEGKDVEDKFEMMDSEKDRLGVHAAQHRHSRGPSFDERTDVPVAMAQAAHASY